MGGGGEGGLGLSGLAMASAYPDRAGTEARAIGEGCDAGPSCGSRRYEALPSSLRLSYAFVVAVGRKILGDRRRHRSRNWQWPVSAIYYPRSS